MAQPAARTTRRLDWVWSGGLLILGAVLPFAARPVGGITATIIGVAGSIAFAAAMLLFAFARHSVVARRPLGVAALVAIAVLAFASYAWAFAPYEDAAAFGGCRSSHCWCRCCRRCSSRCWRSRLRPC